MSWLSIFTSGRLRRIAGAFAAFALICSAFGGIAAAQNVIERLVAPGPLAQTHANLEARCSACHEAFNRTSQDTQCVACHRPVGADISAHTGFHGRNPQINGKACQDCHSEHHGRGATIAAFDQRTFNHEQTDYPLRGAHARVACASCHIAGRKFRAASTACVDCHRADEPHRGRLGVRCSSCHNENSWREIRFDHSDTGYPLQGAHATTRCVACHANERYRGTPRGCVDCHRDDDIHHNSLGPDCGSCHTPANWRSTRFDHSRTDFPLRGAHADIACRQCHVQPAGQVRLPTDCLSCHRADDARAHQGRNGPQCQNCHNESDWKRSSFDHARQTGFALNGAHARITCQQCHVQPAQVVHLSRDCISCHRADDAHAGQEGENCAQCHGESDWKQNVRFDHGLTRFPLIGAHATVTCRSCHANAHFKDAEETCIACHRDDDRHQMRLGPNCETCHNPVAWNRWIFDHDTQTHFPLTGAHAGLQCEACHTRAARTHIDQASACIACHGGDDVHHGEFGADCARCHSTESFRGARPRL